MPSDNTDELARQALEALSGPRESFHSALVATLEQVRGLLDARAGSEEERTARATAELGAFAAGRIDIERFSSLSDPGESLDEGSAAQVERAARTLESLIERGDQVFLARVERGGDLRDTVESALAEAGRAFGAARTAELARSGRYEAERHDGLVDHFPPHRWSRQELSVAPPLVVELSGQDLRTGGLASLLDGAQKIVLVVSGKAPPAALVRLITPGVFVMQADEPESLDRLAEVEGPAVVALLSAEASRFIHYPAVNGRAGRLSVQHLPDEEPKRALGSLSAFQQTEELRHLVALGDRAGGAAVESVQGAAAAEAAVEKAAGPAVEEAPADRLAAWILSQADLTGLD
jgi:hypothetical protein